MPHIILFIGVLLIMARAVKKFVPLSVWNNNPVNIRISKRNEWVGEVPDVINKMHDDEFETFFHAVDGYRAAIILLRNYKKLYGLNTIRGLLNRFAPDFENPTERYIEFVSQNVGIGADSPIAIGNDEIMKSLLIAMHHFESKRVWFGGVFIDAALNKVKAA